MNHHRILAALCCLAISVVTGLGATGRRISDYTETLTVGDAWILEIAVPGVTNYKATFGAIATNIIARGSATVNTNKVDNYNGMVTNLAARGLTLPALTAARSLILNASGNITNVSGTPDGTKYVRDDGTYAVPSGGGAGSFVANSGQFTTNTSLTIKDGALTTNLVIAGVSYIDGILTSGGTNIASFMGSNYFGGRVQIASGSPGVGKVLTSDATGNADWQAPTGGVTPTELNTASNTLSARIVSNDTTTSNGLVNLISSSGSTQVVVAAFGNVNVTNTITATTLSVVNFNANQMTLTNKMGPNEVGLGYQQLTNSLRRATIYADAAAMISNSTGGATFSTEETSSPTNRMYDSYLFSGAVTNLVQFKLAMPLNWDLSTVRVKLWTSSTNNIFSAMTNVWAISASAIKHSSVITNIDWGAEVTITNTVSSLGGQALLTPSTPALTIGNTPAAAGNLVWFRIRRLPGHVDDTDGGLQKLLGAWVQYGETMAEVASW